ncbi:MAG: EAL domain-containing protein [Peptococcaceae bacterium]|nr:EAL domain-containing protein [Peptococcaceae bacterium]
MVKELFTRLEKYQILAEKANDAIFFIDTKGNILEVNTAAEKMYGYSREEFLSMQAYDLRLSGDKSAMVQNMEAAVQAGFTFETVHYHKDGTLIQVEVSLQGTTYDNKTTVLGIIRDITERKQAEAALRESESFLRATQAIGRIGSYKLDFTTRVWQSSAELDNIFGIDTNYTHNVEGWLGIVHPDWREKLAHYYDQVITTRERFDYEYQIARLSDGEARWVHGLGELELDGAGNPVHLMGTIQDITERKAIERALWQEKERAQVTLASIGDGVLTTDVHGRVTFVNAVAQALTGWSNEAAAGLPIEDVFEISHEHTGQTLPQPVRQCLNERRTIALANHAILRHRDGQREFPIEDTAAPIREHDGQVIGAVLVFHDVSEKRILMNRLAHQAEHDALTDLPNRTMFKSRTQATILEAQRRQEQLAVFFLDLNDFKLVNDTLGHAAGDKILCEVGNRLSSVVRPNDMLARHGGDEFLVLVPDLTSVHQAAQLAQTLLSALIPPFQWQGKELFITASIGISIYPNDGAEPETLIQQADMAMYQAKADGRNHYNFFTLALNEQLSERLALQSEMRRALERREFVLFYQPQYRLDTGEFCGMEALVRWLHPTRGLLLPHKFISLAEDSGFILQLGEWVLRTACTYNKQLQDNGYPRARVAVNLSARQFRQKDLALQIDQILTQTGLSPEWLELEITESLSMQDVDLSIEILQRLNQMGIRLSIDDFGTGFSSLSCLSQFPLDTLKIDRSFVAQLNGRSDAIVLTIIQLAQNLGLKVIGEGVETKEQLNFLRARGCDAAQGFLMAKPVPAEKVAALLSSRLFT